MLLFFSGSAWSAVFEGLICGKAQGHLFKSSGIRGYETLPVQRVFDFVPISRSSTLLTTTPSTHPDTSPPHPLAPSSHPSSSYFP